MSFLELITKSNSSPVVIRMSSVAIMSSGSDMASISFPLFIPIGMRLCFFASDSDIIFGAFGSI